MLVMKKRVITTRDAKLERMSFMVIGNWRVVVIVMILVAQLREALHSLLERKVFVFLRGQRAKDFNLSFGLGP